MRFFILMVVILAGCVPTAPMPTPKKTCVPYFTPVCFGNNNCYVDYRCD